MTTQKTRCPYCSSVFAVSNAQLAIRDGYTRCGKCFQVFKADDYLITAKGSEASDDKNTTENQTKNRSHIVDLHKITPTKSKGFDSALDSFLDKAAVQAQAPEESIPEEPATIDYDQKQKEKVNLSVIPNPHPAPELKTPESLSAAVPIAERIPDTPQSLGQEFNEQWLSEVTPEVEQPVEQPTDQEKNTSNIITKTSSTTSTTTEKKADNKDSEGVDDDLMGYLNKNSVAAASASKVKTERVLPGMNDFHENQRSKKKTKSLPMHFQTTKRNVALDKLKERKSFFNINLFHTLGWLVLSFLMVALLAVQYVFFNFDQLAANPSYQPIMHKACLQLGCDVPLIDIDKIKLTKVLARRYQADPTATKFTATMTNSAEESQPFPTIRLLVLKDKQVISGRIIHPAEYLTSGYNSQARIIPNKPTEIEFVVKISREEIPVFALDPVR
ncbi:MAG: zinc-ribbon and DUF3426 domain-containing protein [Gammaproteobacteria bacterium]|nr:zinc-ribbon and DUF3426 domain-containing protein [Gammaproteobacteria bacterium]